MGIKLRWPRVVDYNRNTPLVDGRHGDGIDHFHAALLMEVRAMPLCLHCRVRQELKGHRGLCQSCYENKEIRVRYPSRGTPRPEEDRNILNPPLPEPTRALPGTEAKVRVLTERARTWRRLWHPRDARADIK
jgi:hypothetical protein